jgi:hypothetical protein
MMSAKGTYRQFQSEAGCFTIFYMLMNQNLAALLVKSLVRRLRDKGKVKPCTFSLKTYTKDT